MAFVVRMIVGAAAGVSVPLDDDGDCVCADTNTAAAKHTKARDSFFTMILDLGETERFPTFYMVGDK